MYNSKQELRETLKLAYPVSIGQLGHILLGIEDSLMVGKVGAVPLAAASLVNGLVFLVVVFGLGMSLAVTPLTAIANGEKKLSECSHIFNNSLLVNSTIALILFLLTFFAADLIIYLKQKQDVAISAISYAKIISLSIIPFMLFLTVKQFTEGLSITKPAMYATIIANFVNILVNWLLIYGNLGFPTLGLDGAGYATLATRLALIIVMFGYILKSKNFIQFHFFRFKKSWNLNIVKQLLRIGIPTGLQHFFEVGAFSTSAVMIGWLGSKALAAHQIALSMAAVSFMIILGISSAGTIRVGSAMGRKNRPEIRRSGFLAIVVASSIMGFFGIVFIVLKGFLPKLFINDIEVILIASNLLIVAAFFQVSDGVQAVGLGILRGIKDVRIPMYISFFAYWIIGLPVGYILGFTFELGVTGIWIGLLVGLTLAAIFLSIRFHLKSRDPSLLT
jgi:MATE family multidrug resistance protein